MIKRRGRKERRKKTQHRRCCNKKTYTMQYAFNNALIMSRRRKMDRAFRKCLNGKEIVADYQNCLFSLLTQAYSLMGANSLIQLPRNILNNSTDSTHIFIFVFSSQPLLNKIFGDDGIMIATMFNQTFNECSKHFKSRQNLIACSLSLLLGARAFDVVLIALHNSRDFSAVITERNFSSLSLLFVVS